MKRLVNLPDPKSLGSYQPESTDQREDRATVEHCLAKLRELRVTDEVDAGFPSRTDELFGDKDSAGGPKMSEKRGKLENLIQDAMKVRFVILMVFTMTETISSFF